MGKTLEQKLRPSRRRASRFACAKAGPSFDLKQSRLGIYASSLNPQDEKLALFNRKRSTKPVSLPKLNLPKLSED